MGSMIHYADFNKIAFAYDFLKKLVFGKKIEEAQLALVAHIPSNARVLIIGGGTGQLLKEILDRRAVESITYVELSDRMIKTAKNKVQKEKISKVHFVHGTVALLENEPRFDVVLTPFVLDLYREHELLELMKPLDNRLRQSGVWLCCDFQITSKSLSRKLWQQGLMTTMYYFFSLTSKLKAKRLPDYEAAFKQLGYKSIAAYSFYGDLIHSKVFRKNKTNR